MKSVITAVLIGFVSASSLCCGQVYAAEKAQMLVEAPPETTQKTGTTDASLPFGRFPKFIVKGTTDNPLCEQWIADNLSNAPACFATIQTDKATSAALKSCVAGNKYTPYGAGGNTATWSAYNCDFVDVPELVITNYAIPAEYRKTANLLVTWTIRLEGTATPLALWPTLCSPWHGVTVQDFPAGDVVTQLSVSTSNKGVFPIIGNQFSLTIPYGGSVVSAQPWDPTLTGSYLITPADFGGEMPESFTRIAIQWRNNCAMPIKSPAGRRNILITLMPVSKGQIEENQNSK
jgi:hypothetical protein